MSDTFNFSGKYKLGSSRNLPSTGYNTAGSNFYKPYSVLNSTSDGHKMFTVRDTNPIRIQSTLHPKLSANQNNAVKSSKDPNCVGMTNMLSNSVPSPYPYPRITPTNDLVYDETDKHIPPTGIVSFTSDLYQMSNS
jgi:hypothetical protein